MRNAGKTILEFGPTAETTYSPYRTVYMTWLAEDGTEMNILVIADDDNHGLVIPCIADVLIPYQNRRQVSGKTYAHYMKIFLDYMYYKFSLKDLTEVIPEHLEAFTDHLHNLGVKKHTAKLYSFLLDKLFDHLRSTGLLAESSSLVTLNRRYSSVNFGACGRCGCHLTNAGAILRRRILRWDEVPSIPMRSYEKILSPEAYQIAEQALPFRDKIILRISCETGYRLNSILSIRLDNETLRLLDSQYVQASHSKTGQLHCAKITSKTCLLILEYIDGERAAAVEKGGADCEYLFVNSKGKNVGRALNYDAYYHSLRQAERKIREQYPDMYEFSLYGHAGRATFLNYLMDSDDRLSDSTICQHMDWKNTQCISNYRDMKRAVSVDSAGLLNDMERRLETRANEASDKSAI